MKKNLTKKLFLSVLTLAFAVVSLGASTFAWFTVSKEAEVEEFTAEVVGGSGIEIAVGTVTGTAPTSEYYVAQLPKTAIEAALKEATFEKFDNVTSLKYDSENKTLPTGAQTFASKLYTLEGKDAAVKDYVALRFYVRVEAAGQLTLDTVGMSRVANATYDAAWTSGVKYNLASAESVEVSATDTVAFNVVDAARIAVVQGNESLVYETEATAGSVTGGNGTAGNKQGYSSLGAAQVYNSKMEPDLPSITDQTLPSQTIGADDAQYITIDVEADNVYTFDVYVWLEGYDGECINAIFAQTLKIDLGFAWVAESE